MDSSLQSSGYPSIEPSSSAKAVRNIMALQAFQEDRYGNLEHYLNYHFDWAHHMLQTDVDRAECMFIKLLRYPYLPLWKRTQCNFVLASISEETSDAIRYLADARHMLSLYEQGCNARPDPLEAKILKMHEQLDKVSRQIAERINGPSESGSASVGEHHAEPQVSPSADWEGSGGQPDLHDDEDNQLYRYEGDPLVIRLATNTIGMQVDGHNSPAAPRNHSPIHAMTTELEDPQSTPGASVFDQ